MFKTLKNAWKTPDLQKKMLFTLFIVLLYRLGACICVPYVSGTVSEDFSAAFGSSTLGLMSMLSGSAMQYVTLFALSVSPYITASIVMQLLTVAIPALERMAKDGAEGQKKINSITRYVTVALALITSFGYSMIIKTGTNGHTWLSDSVGSGEGQTPVWFAMIVINACFVAGAALVMWIAELINDKGIGNGISVILCVNIIASFPSLLLTLVNSIKNSEKLWVDILVAVGVVAIAVLAIAFIIFIDDFF